MRRRNSIQPIINLSEYQRRNSIQPIINLSEYQKEILGAAARHVGIHAITEMSNKTQKGLAMALRNELDNSEITDADRQEYKNQLSDVEALIRRTDKQLEVSDITTSDCEDVPRPEWHSLFHNKPTSTSSTSPTVSQSYSIDTAAEDYLFEEQKHAPLDRSLFRLNIGNG